jgi:hypothetical protein
MNHLQTEKHDLQIEKHDLQTEKNILLQLVATQTSAMLPKPAAATTTGKAINNNNIIYIDIS